MQPTLTNAQIAIADENLYSYFAIVNISKQIKNIHDHAILYIAIAS